MELKPGVQVRRKSTRDSIGIVCDKPVEIIAGEKYYTISFGNSVQLEKICESDLEIFDGIPSIEELLLSGTYGSKENCFRIITLYKLIKPLRDHIYAIYSSKTAFQPYQFKPVLKYLSSQNRSLLLADEVGLGKTIEAGFIVTEEMARKEIERVLIICPARLRQKWQEEFKRRFNLRMEIKEPNEIVSFFEEFSNRGYPKNLQAVCSLEGLRKREIVENFESSAPPLDFLIVDEAHHLRNSSTLSHRLVRALRDGTDSTLLLTATPVHLTSENFLNLLKILSPQQFTDSSGFQLRLQYNECIVNAQNILYHFSSTNGENILKQCKDALEKLKNVVKEEDLIKNPLYNDIIYRLTIFKNPQPRQIVELQRDLNNLNLFSYIMCRTRKRDVIEKQPKRCPEVVNVNFSVIEEEIYRKIMEYVENKIRISKENKGNIIFGMTMPQRLAASCLPAALEYYQNKIKTEIIDGTDVSPDGITYNYTFDENLYNIQEKLLSLQKHFTKDSKFEALVNKISQIDEIEPGRQIIIFSYFKATLNYLEKELKNRGYNCLVIHGDIPSIPEKPQEDERGKRIKEFRQNPEIKILLSSEVGSEGLDFEFVHIMFNYDLPWNPMLVEQRIGRLDRYNQKSERILIYNMAVKDTIEERILQRLYDRIGIFEKTIGDLEPILGEVISKNISSLLTSKLTEEEEKEKIEQIVRTIENKQLEYEELEKNRIKFVGYDTFFVDEIEEVKKMKKYITDKELYIFVKEFIENTFKECGLEKTKNEKKFILHYSNKLVTAIKELKGVKEEYKGKFLNYCYMYMDQGLPITFSSEFAYENPDIEYVNMQHPLVKLALEYYRDNPQNLHPVSKIQLAKIPDLNILQGDYLFYVYTITTRGFQDGITLEPIFINLQNKEFLPLEISELLLVEMIESGETFMGDPYFQREFLEEIIHLIKEEFGRRLKFRKETLQKTNEASIENLRTHFKSSFQYNIDTKNKKLENAIKEQKDERYIRMLKGTIKKSEERLESKMRELDNKKNLSFSHNEIASGFLRIKGEK